MKRNKAHKSSEVEKRAKQNMITDRKFQIILHGYTGIWIIQKRYLCVKK